jgi:hypothetical protein
MLARGARLGQRIAAATGFVAACLVALYLHATATIMVAALGVHSLVVLALRGGPARQDLLLLGAVAAAIALGAAWWLWRAVGIAGDPASAVAWIARPDPGDSVAVLAEVLGGFHLGRLKSIPGAVMAALMLAGAAIAWRRREAEPLGLAAAFAFGAAALHGLSQVTPVMLDRTALALLVFAAPLIGFALARIRPRAAGLGLAVLLLALALRGTTMRAEAMAREGHGEDWRRAAATLASRAAPGDILLLAGAAELGVMPFLAPPGAPPLRQRVAPAPGERLEQALVAAAGRGTWFDAAEACGATVWLMARAPDADLRLRALALPPAVEETGFGLVVLRRLAMLPCAHDGTGGQPPSCRGPAVRVQAGGVVAPGPSGRVMSTVSTQRPCFHPVAGSTPAGWKPIALCSPIEGAFAESPITAIISLSPCASQRAMSPPSSPRATPPRRASGAT